MANVIEKVVQIRGVQVLVVVSKKQFDKVLGVWSDNLINPLDNITFISAMIMLDIIEMTAKRGKIGGMNVRIKIPKTISAFRMNKYILKAFNKHIWKDLKREVERRLKEKTAA